MSKQAESKRPSPITAIQAVRDGTHPTAWRKNSFYVTAWHNERLHVFWRDGQRRVFNLALVSQSNHYRAKLHGFQQRVQDAAAGREGLEQQRLAMYAVMDHLESGSPDWELPRTTGGPAIAMERVCMALVRLGKFKDADGALGFIEGLAKKREVEPGAIAKIVAQDKAVAGMILEIMREEAEARAETVSLDDLLGEMEVAEAE